MPETDSPENRNIIFTIRRSTEDYPPLCHAEYKVEIRGSKLAELYHYGGRKLCDADAEVSFHDSKKSIIDKVTGNNMSRMSFVVRRDDNDWRFMLSNSELTTEREGRELRIKVPNPQLHFDAEAKIWMITGQCIMTNDNGPQ
jgi:hypothetical protein